MRSESKLQIWSLRLKFILLDPNDSGEESSSIVVPHAQDEQSSSPPPLRIHNRDIVTLDIYNSDGVYMCRRQDIETKIRTHLTQTNAYVLLEELNHTTNHTYIGQHLDNAVEHLTLLLNDLLVRQCITHTQFYQMLVERSTVRMDYLYFLSEPNKEGMPFRALMICELNAYMGISRLISRLLQPIYDEVAHSTTFFKANDAVYALEMYNKKNLLQSTTLFATFHVPNLCTMLPHKKMIAILERFLNENIPSSSSSSSSNVKKIQGLTIQTIIELVRLVIENQMFLFHNQVYRQTKGGAESSPLWTLLANIFMFYWQAELVEILNDKNEVFGRCFDDIFLTWNGTNSALRSLINMTTKKRNPSIPITISIGQKIRYLSVQIYHMYGTLKTKVSHEIDGETPRIIPYIYDHPPHTYSTLIRACLIRAILCCSTLSDFQEEHRLMKNFFLYNDFSAHYITHKVNRFFEEFNALSLKSSDTANEHQYNNIRQSIFDYEQQQNEIKIKQHKEEQQQQEIWYIPFKLHGKVVNDPNIGLKEIWKLFMIKEPQLHDIHMKLALHRQYPSNTI